MSNTSVKLIPLPSLNDNYIWILIDDSQKFALVIDPGESSSVIQFLKKENLLLQAILITHHHWDHTNGIPDLINHFDVPVYGPATEKINHLSIPVKDSDKISFPSFPLSFTVIAIPGHTLGHVAYYAPPYLFCGDTLFASGCGRIFEGTVEEMYASLQKIAGLPDDTLICCAHEYTLNNLRFAEIVEPSNSKIKTRKMKVTELRDQRLPSLPSLLSEERETNPFLRCQAEEVIKNVEKYAGHHLTNTVDVFGWLRKWKDHF